MRTTRMKWADGCFLTAAAVSVAFGAVYLTTPHVLPYHEQALGEVWAAMDATQQTVLLSLLRIIGGGFLAVGIATAFFVLRPHRRREPWITAAILTTSMALILPTSYAVAMVRLRTDGNPPWAPLALTFVLMLIGGILEYQPRRQHVHRWYAHRPPAQAR